MTVTNVADYPFQTGSIRRIAESVMAMPVVLDGAYTEVKLAQVDLPAAGQWDARTLPARSLTGFRREGEHPAPVHHLRVTSPALRGGQWHHRLIVTPGAVQLSTCRREGWEARSMPAGEVRKLVNESTKLRRKLEAVARSEPWFTSYELQDRLIRRISEIADLLGTVKRETKVRGEVTAWSEKSQRRMIRRIASLDWSTFKRPGFEAAMVTLTYPGDWLAFAPNGRCVKRHLNAFRSWYSRRTAGEDRGIWKLEFQGRGAPHLHLLLLVPELPTCRRNGEPSFADECRQAWHRIVTAGVPALLGPFTAEHQDRDRFHARAGVSIDTNEGGRMVDPVRIGAYFAKHGRYGGKAYQHELPAEWAAAAADDEGARPGRWWGYWKLDPVEVAGELATVDTVELRRLLRGWIGAQGPREGLNGSPVVPRAYQRDVWRVRADSIDTTTGEIRPGSVRKRRVKRRFKVSTMSHPVPTGFVLINDAPAVVLQLARAFAEKAEWPPGQRRPLP